MFCQELFANKITGGISLAFWQRELIFKLQFNEHNQFPSARYINMRNGSIHGMHAHTQLHILDILKILTIHI